MFSVNKNTYIETFVHYIIVFALVIFISSAAWSQQNDGYRIKKVVIDAGHGGKDTGARGRKALEKDITLAVALKVGSYISTNFEDVKVIYTRKNDIFVPLNDRSRIANESGADLFISIHCNANPSREPYGTETYVMGQHKSQDNLEVAMRENAVITYEEDYNVKYEGYDPNSSESFIIFSLLQHAFLDQSLNMASLIQDEFRERARRRDRGVKQAGFLVLWKASMPSVLVELGFLSNPKEEDFLMTSAGQDYLASSIFRAFRAYKERVEARSNFTAQTQFDSSIKGDNNKQPTQISTQWFETPPQTNKAVFGKGVVYKVQLTVASKSIPTNSNVFKGLEGVEELQVDGIYKYLVGGKVSYNEIVEFCQQVRQIFPDAFIVSFKDGVQIPLQQAINITSN